MTPAAAAEVVAQFSSRAPSSMRCSAVDDRRRGQRGVRRSRAPRARAQARPTAVAAARNKVEMRRPLLRARRCHSRASPSLARTTTRARWRRQNWLPGGAGNQRRAPPVKASFVSTTPARRRSSLTGVSRRRFSGDECRDDGVDPRQALFPARRSRSRRWLIDGELQLLAVFDKPDPLEGPFFEETIYLTPSQQRPETVRAAVAIAGRRRHEHPWTARTARSTPSCSLAPPERPGSARPCRSRSPPTHRSAGRCSTMLHFADGSTLEQLDLVARPPSAF